jgi:hypothetical protein
MSLDKAKAVPFNYNDYKKPSMYQSEFDKLPKVADENHNIIPVGYHEWDSLAQMDY